MESKKTQGLEKQTNLENENRKLIEEKEKLQKTLKLFQNKTKQMMQKHKVK